MIIPTPRTDRAIVRKPEHGEQYVPAQKCRDIETELILFVDRHNTAGTLTPGDVFEIATSQRGIESGFLHDVWALDEHKSMKDGGSQRPTAVKRRHEYRIFLRSKTSFAEATNEDLRAAVAECFERLDLNFPEALR